MCDFFLLLIISVSIENNKIIVGICYLNIIYLIAFFFFQKDK